MKEIKNTEDLWIIENQSVLKQKIPLGILNQLNMELGNQIYVCVGKACHYSEFRFCLYLEYIVQVEGCK